MPGPSPIPPLDYRSPRRDRQESPEPNPLRSVGRYLLGVVCGIFAGGVPAGVIIGLLNDHSPQTLNGAILPVFILGGLLIVAVSFFTGAFGKWFWAGTIGGGGFAIAAIGFLGMVGEGMRHA